MSLVNRNRLTCSTTTRTAKVLGLANGLGFRFARTADADRMATDPSPGATPSRGYPGADPSQHRRERDCQSPPAEPAASARVALWRPRPAAKPANPN